ncbi:MAG: 4-hydroxy-tetrahydrodipicolinate reductase [Desulfovibrionaceae bacterium]
MIDIILLGSYGRMGKMIQESVIENPETTLCAIVEHPDKSPPTMLPEHCSFFTDINKAITYAPKATIIDFTNPYSTMYTARCAHKNNNPLVIGTTGLCEEEEKELSILAKTSPILLASNMSRGITALLHILPEFIASLGKGYDIEISEIHHQHKKDAPSGTAISLGKKIADSKGWDFPSVAKYHRENIHEARKEKEIGIQSIRGGDVAGVHTLYFLGEGERIEITHHAHSRKTFAEGAVHAALWLSKQKARTLYSMQDTLQ